MKHLTAIVLVTLFAAFAIADMVHDFLANDTLHYFSEQPHRLLLVAAIGIVGGLVAFFFYQLSRGSQRRVKLVALGSAAIFATLAVAWLLYRAADFKFAGGHILAFALLSVSAVALLLWFEFYQLFSGRAL